MTSKLPLEMDFGEDVRCLELPYAPRDQNEFDGMLQLLLVGYDSVEEFMDDKFKESK